MEPETTLIAVQKKTIDEFKPFSIIRGNPTFSEVVKTVIQY